MIYVPVLVVHRRDDSAIPADNGRALAGRIPGAALLELEGTDHFVFVDHEPVLDAVLAFLDDRVPGTAATGRGACDRVLATLLSLGAPAVGCSTVGPGVEPAAAASELAEPGEVLVSRTVRDLVAGSGIELAARGAFPLAASAELWELYRPVAPVR